MQVYSIGVDDLTDYDIKEFGNCEWVVYEYETGCYEGWGDAIGFINGQIGVKNLGHCSCYGPTDGGFYNTMSVETFIENLANVRTDYGSEKLIEKVRELLGK